MNMETETIEDIAEELYTTYCAAVGGKAFNGDSLPDWETFRGDPKKQVQVLAWLRTAERAVEII